MNGNELLKRLRRLARDRNLQLKLVRERGKGSHATLYLGTRFTILKDRKKEIGPGLLLKLLRDLAYRDVGEGRKQDAEALDLRNRILNDE